MPGVPGGPWLPFSAKHFGIQFADPVQFFFGAFGTSTISKFCGTRNAGSGNSSLRGHPLMPPLAASFQNCCITKMHREKYRSIYCVRIHLNQFAHLFTAWISMTKNVLIKQTMANLKTEWKKRSLVLFLNFIHIYWRNCTSILYAYRIIWKNHVTFVIFHMWRTILLLRYFFSSKLDIIWAVTSVSHFSFPCKFKNKNTTSLFFCI